MPVRQVKRGFGAVNDRFTESDGKTDRGVVDLVVVSVVIDHATKVVQVELGRACEYFE